MVDIRILHTKEEYDSFINQEKVVLKFSADWCSPCRVLGGIINKLDPEKLNGYKFGEVNVEDDFADDITRDLNIRNIPVCVYFNNGKEVKRTIGMLKAEDIYNNVIS